MWSQTFALFGVAVSCASASAIPVYPPAHLSRRGNEQDWKSPDGGNLDIICKLATHSLIYVIEREYISRLDQNI